MSAKNPLDAVEYICDFLPDYVYVKIRHKGKCCLLAFKMNINCNGSKGLMLGYDYDLTATILCNYTNTKWAEQEKIWQWNDTFRDKLNKRFNANYDDFIYLAEYIRSCDELKFAARACFHWLGKHKLHSARIRNVRMQLKLFNVTSFLKA